MHMVARASGKPGANRLGLVRAVARVIVSLRLTVPGTQRQGWLGPIQRLNSALLVHAQHQRPIRRIEVQSNDFVDLIEEVRVAGDGLRRNTLTASNLMPRQALGAGQNQWRPQLFRRRRLLRRTQRSSSSRSASLISHQIGLRPAVHTIRVSFERCTDHE